MENIRFAFVSILLTSFAYISGVVNVQAEAVISIPDRFPDSPVRFIRDAILAHDGTIWVVGEKSGIYRLSATTEYDKNWFDLRYFNGLPETNDYTCIAEDHKHRIWVGSHGKGVAVFNGEEWKCYDRQNVLSGDHVFDIAVSPVSGEVVIATSGGLTIYNPSNESWNDLNRSDGLVENQIESMAFDEKGNLWLAYGCGGVSFLNTNYSLQRTFQAKWYCDPLQYQRYSPKDSGEGLPSNFCNYIYAGKDDKIFVCTVSGLGFSINSRNWKYLRGSDYESKNNGGYKKIEKSNGAKKKSDTQKSRMLPEDFLTCFSESGEGYWIGTRRQGAALLNKKTLKVVKYFRGSKKDAMSTKWISAIIPFPDGSVLAATYGGGVTFLTHGRKKFSIKRIQKDTLPSFPHYPGPISSKEMKDELNRLESLRSPKNTSAAYYWNEDWNTLGDWCEKHGRDKVVLCGMAKGQDVTYSLNDQIKIEGNVGGDNRTKKDELRRWIHWDYVDIESNRNVLFCPSICLRRESEWDDHGEAYSPTLDGPDVWVIVNIPSDGYELSLYFYNPNGYKEAESKRDYFIELRKYDEMQLSIYNRKDSVSFKSMIANIKNILMSRIQKLPVLARTRVRFFAAGGVYKTFVINRKGRYYFRICRNNSFNTILNGIFVSQMSRNNRKSEEFLESFIHYAYNPPAPPNLNEEQKRERSYMILKDINDYYDFKMNPGLMDQMDRMKLKNYRFAKNNSINDDILHHLRWDLKIQEPQDAAYFDQSVRKCWEYLQLYQTPFRSKEWAPKSPGVIPFSIEEIMAMEEMEIDWRDFQPSKYPSEEYIKNTKIKIKQYMNKK